MNNILDINNTFGAQILVNGNKCKQYNHNGKIFIQANPGSEYSIEIKNNHWKRILAVTSIDGLNVLTGKTANENDTGYIIGAYSSEKIKGFRISDSEWALFKFGYKFDGNTYAQSKEDGSEKNCGVIGLRFFYEKEPILVNSIFTNTSNVHNIYENKLINCCDNYSENGGLYGKGRYGYEPSNIDMNFCSSPAPHIPQENFDCGTEFGRRETSKVKNVDFERGYLVQSFDIYYASRRSLINMGIPLDNILQSNLPQSFPNNYCIPPKEWNG
jgi:hypothetical protein